MSPEENVINYLRSGGATQGQIDDFIDWCNVICLQPGGNGDEKRRRFWCYRMWARLLRKRRTPFPRDGKFIIHECLKVYLRKLTGGDPVDPPCRVGSIRIQNSDFVKYVVRFLDDAY